MRTSLNEEWKKIKKKTLTTKAELYEKKKK
jgi:hypothetical protein